ncbi:MAG: hypothetical protein LBJ11_03030 [Oscillospiraceae bacterium]|jgi:hypothetical protein|nr:hypothetical protein [Oscillospiraceae bacterium]
MRKKIITTLILCGMLMLTACSNNADDTMLELSSEPSAVITSESAATDTSTVEPEISSDPTAPVSSEAQTANAAADSKVTSNAAGTDNKTANPPATNTPAATQSAEPTQTQPPASSTPTVTEPPKPAFTETDYAAIIQTVREYGEGKGFIWDDSFTFEQGHQYYGRPSLENDGYNGVISMLKFHCDKIERQVGICYFKVVKHIYEGKTEFVVLYD